MAVTIELPADIEESLRRQFGNLEEAAKEAALVELFRQRVLTHHQLSAALGLDRYETDGILKRHDVSYDLTREEFMRQRASLRPESDR